MSTLLTAWKTFTAGHSTCVRHHRHVATTIPSGNLIIVKSTNARKRDS
ncbi:hypothetical protein HMPREF9578_00256 [Cutibacterium acnes HL110PA4]|nr:hypothetical protein HMPREF9578_00256 [Cutibacterium acnes HL110PA4]